MNLSKKIVAIGLAAVTLSTVAGVAATNASFFDLTRAVANKESVGTSTTYSADLQLKADYEDTTLNFIYTENKYAIEGTGTLHLEWTEGNSREFSIFNGEKYLGISTSGNTFYESDSPTLWTPTTEGIRTTYNNTTKFLYYNNGATRVAPYTNKMNNNGTLQQQYSIAYFYTTTDFLNWDTHCEGSFARQCLYNLAYGIAITKYTISFDANGGSGTMNDVTVEEGTIYTLPACTFTAPENKEFDYWSIGTTKQTEPLTINSNVTLKANWKNKVVPVGSTITIDFSTQEYANAEEITSVTIQGFSFVFDKGSGSTTPKYYNTGTAIRLYGGNTMTVSGHTITQIIFTFSSGEGSNTITSNPGSISNGKWTGESNSITFTIGGTSGHRRIKAVEITYQ